MKTINFEIGSPELEILNPNTIEKTIDSYEIDSEGVKTRVEILKKSMLPFYNITIPQIGAATDALLETLKEKLSDSFNLTNGELQDPITLKEIKKEFSEKASKLINGYLPGIEPEKTEQLVNRLRNSFFGLGNMQFLLDDHNIEEVVVNSIKEPVRIYHKKYGWMKTSINIKTENEILNHAHRIARGVGRELSTLNPKLDAYLATGDRVNATLNPISLKGHTITIRKFSRDPWTMIDFLENKTINYETAALIWLAVEHEMNIIISGGTGSGKTSFLNTCMPFIPPSHRIISLEDTRELQLPEYLYWCPMITREANHEGRGEITMLDLLINTLRMRPDRIVMGEIRRQKEAEVLFEAMHTGHSVYSTLHANTCKQTLNRLTNPPINIPQIMLDSLHLNVVMHRDRKTGKRKVFEVGEFIPTTEDPNEDASFTARVLYRWNPIDDELHPEADEINLYQRISLYTGLSNGEIEEDLETKKRILAWLKENNIRKIEDVGYIMNHYYTEPEKIIESAYNNISPEEILKEKLA